MLKRGFQCPTAASLCATPLQLVGHVPFWQVGLQPVAENCQGTELRGVNATRKTTLAAYGTMWTDWTTWTRGRGLGDEDDNNTARKHVELYGCSILKRFKALLFWKIASSSAFFFVAVTCSLITQGILEFCPFTSRLLLLCVMMLPTNLYSTEHRILASSSFAFVSLSGACKIKLNIKCIVFNHGSHTSRALTCSIHFNPTNMIWQANQIVTRAKSNRSCTVCSGLIFSLCFGFWRLILDHKDGQTREVDEKCPQLIS